MTFSRAARLAGIRAAIIHKISNKKKLQPKYAGTSSILMGIKIDIRGGFHMGSKNLNHPQPSNERKSPAIARITGP